MKKTLVLLLFVLTNSLFAGVTPFEEPAALINNSSPITAAGSSYSIAATVWAFDGAGAVNGFFAAPAANLTFAGTGSQVVGDLGFGTTDFNTGDALQELVAVETESVVTMGNVSTYTVSIALVAQEKASGALTTWVAPGTLNPTSMDAFQISFINIGEGNAGVNPLEVNVPAGATYSFVGQDNFIVATDGSTFAFNPPTPDAGTAIGELTGTVGFLGAPDLSGPVTALGGALIAGYGEQFTYTITVPEPSSILIVLSSLLALAVGRRR